MATGMAVASLAAAAYGGYQAHEQNRQANNAREKAEKLRAQQQAEIKKQQAEIKKRRTAEEMSNDERVNRMSGNGGLSNIRAGVLGGSKSAGLGVI